MTKDINPRRNIMTELSPIILLSSGTYTISGRYKNYLIDNSTGGSTLILPKIITSGQVFYISQSDKISSSNNTIVNCDAKDTMDWKLSSITLVNQQQVRLVSIIDSGIGNWDVNYFGGQVGPTGATGPTNYVMAGNNNGLQTFNGPIIFPNTVTSYLDFTPTIYNDGWIIGVTGAAGQAGTSFSPTVSGLYNLDFNLQVITSSQRLGGEQSNFRVSLVDTNGDIDVIGTNREFQRIYPTFSFLNRISESADINVNILANLSSNVIYAWKYIMIVGNIQYVIRCYCTITPFKF